VTPYKYALAGLVMLATGGSPWQLEAVRLRYNLPTSVSLGEPVVVTMTVENASSKPTAVDLGWNRVGAFMFQVLEPGGTRRQFKPTIEEGIAKNSIVRVQPNDSFEQWVVLDEWFEFRRAGNYSVSISIDTTTARRLGASLSVPGEGPQVVRVEPRNDVRLRRRCQELLSLIVPRSPRFLEALKVLTHVSDPVAVPYLRQVLAADPAFGSQIVAGLERIKNPEAIAVLEKLSTGSDAEVRAAAKAALVRIGRRQ